MQQKRYLLRGGVIGVIVGYILGLLPIIPLIPIIGKVFYSFLYLPNFILPQFVELQLSTSFIYLFSILLYHFVLGSIVGWIYGKIKNRNKSEII